MTWSKKVEDAAFDPKDPNPWAALYFDTSLALAIETKSAILNNQNSWSRRILLPIIRPISYLLAILFQVIRIFIPKRFRASKALHYLIYYGLKYFVRPDASYLIIRHFNIGSSILKFIADNANIEIKSTIPLKPQNLEGLIDNTFLTHDLNIFNFITELNTKLKKENRSIITKEMSTINFDAIVDDFNIEIPKNGLFNVIDLQSAVEIYTPLFALFLSSNDFWRANNSLQLDETIAIYTGRIVGDLLPVSLVINRHPIIPYAALNVGFRLMIHGLDTELLFSYLLKLKHQVIEHEYTKK
jgi:hypothetical protein